MRLRSVLLATLVTACGGGSGGDDDVTPDAPDEVADIGFKKPAASLKANKEVDTDMWEEQGPADMTCLNTANSDQAVSLANGVMLSTVVRDFQSDNLVPNAMIEVFANQDVANPFLTTAANGDAEVTLTIPMGTKRFGYRMTDAESLDTLLLNQKVEPDMAAQTESSIRTVSKATAQTMPALIGISRTPGTGVLAGAMRDCQDREVSNFVAAVTTTPGTLTTGTHAQIEEQIRANLVPGSDTYYFSSSVGLPVRHTQKAAASEDGLFMVVELSVAPTAIVQIWGYLTDEDFAADKLTLIGQLQTESKSDTVITGSYEPLRTE